MQSMTGYHSARIYSVSSNWCITCLARTIICLSTMSITPKKKCSEKNISKTFSGKFCLATGQQRPLLTLYISFASNVYQLNIHHFTHKWRTSSHLNNSRHQKGNCAYMDKSIQCPQNSCRTYNNVKPSQNVCCFQKLNYLQQLQDLHCSLRIHGQELQVTPLTVHHIDNIFLWSLNSCPTDRKLFIT
jgi:hypothetical protein